MPDYRTLRLSDKDLDFLVETASPGVTDRSRLKQIVKEDQDFRNRFINFLGNIKSFYLIFIKF